MFVFSFPWCLTMSFFPLVSIIHLRDLEKDATDIQRSLDTIYFPYFIFIFPLLIGLFPWISLSLQGASISCNEVISLTYIFSWPNISSFIYSEWAFPWAMSDKYRVGLYDIVKYWHWNIFLFCGIYWEMKHLNSCIWKN